jgi:hypothetical protein
MKKLSSVLKISAGEVCPRHDWRALKVQELCGITPSISWIQYVKFCERLAFKPSALEWSKICFQRDDEFVA